MSDDRIQITRTADPLSAAIPLPYEELTFPYGFAVKVASNSALIPRMAKENWSHWSRRFSTRPLEVRCIVQPSPLAAQAIPTPVYRAQANLFTIVAGVDNFAACDLSTGFAFGCFSEQAVSEQEDFRYLFLDGMIYSMLESLHTLSIHAACVSKHGHGLLLAGESGAGKSTLSYACALRGWTYISDDASVLARNAYTNIVFGESRRFRFRETAGDIFPEFRGLRNPTNRPGGGKPTIEVGTGTLPGICTANEAQVRSIVFLKRHQQQSKPAELIAFTDLQEAASRLFTNLWPAELQGNHERLEALNKLLTTNMYELHYCGLNQAVAALDRLTSKDRT